ncbi:MAG TPA: glycosyltransferase family 4 protein [Pyrinomonadaceae bacterium]|nr:glycosyltransferase family 4 protein [Pyrinomonadaceae bacterium]
MKILITAPSLDENENVSGISTVVRQIIERGNFDYTHFSAGRRDGEQQSATWIFRQIGLPFRFRKEINHEKFDIAHINTAFNPLSIVRDFMLVKAAKIAKCRVLLHVHGGKFLAREFENNFVKKIAEKMLRSSDIIVVLSKLEKQILENLWNGLNIKVLENAIAVEDFLPALKKKNSLIFLGRLNESKGLNEIIEVVSILKTDNYDFTFRAFGAGEMQDYFVDTMKKVLGEKFYFGGIISGEIKQKELAESDIFLLPSRYGEGLPMAMLEAMAAANIVVVSEMASIGAVVKDNFNGFLIKPKNTTQLINKLEYILSGKNNLEKIRQNARKMVEEKFNLKDYIKKLENIYTEISQK